MLHEFLTAHQAELIERCQAKVVLRRSPVAGAGLESGIPLFLEQIIKTLRVEQTSDPIRGRRVSGPSTGEPAYSEIGETAARHGRELLHCGYSVNQVVHDYGDLCQSITDLAVEYDAPISVDEFRTLNRCLDNGIADAVTEFGYQRDILFADTGVKSLNERVGFLAHELRNFLNTATLALDTMKTGAVGLNGQTSGVLDRSLTGMRTLVSRTLADVRVTAGLPVRHDVFSLADFIAEVHEGAALEAQARERGFSVAAVDPKLGVEGDRDTLYSAVGNLLQNAFKFTHKHTNVSLSAHAVGDRIMIEVEDHCGGLPPGDLEAMFQAFSQYGVDKSGLGLGLSICRRGVEANKGVLHVRDIPGSGCVFTIDLPRHLLLDGSPAPDETVSIP